MHIKKDISTGENMFEVKKLVSVDGVFALIDSQKGPDFHFDGESHPFWEMVFVKEGKVGVSADERIYSLSAGDVIFHKPMEFHRIWALDNTSPRLNIITFSASGEKTAALENMTAHLDEDGIKLVTRIVDKGKRAFVFRKGNIIDCAADERLCQEYCNYIEIFLLSLTNKKLSEPLCTDSSSDSKLFSDVVLYMRENIGAKLCVEQIANEFFVSPSRIKKLFSKYSGIGVIGYFNNMKVLEAGRLLSDGYTASETAEKLGFANQFYFCTVFKKITGTTPSEFKRK